MRFSAWLQPKGSYEEVVWERLVMPLLDRMRRHLFPVREGPAFSFYEVEARGGFVCGSA